MRGMLKAVCTAVVVTGSAVVLAGCVAPDDAYHNPPRVYATAYAPNYYYPYNYYYYPDYSATAAPTYYYYRPGFYRVDLARRRGHVD